jgi:hypothetical protein
MATAAMLLLPPPPLLLMLLLLQPFTLSHPVPPAWDIQL